MKNIFSKMFPKDASSLLKEATAAKQEGEIDKAVELLRQAYLAISKTTVIYGIETFLKLPLYLQAAGKVDDAWHEFNLLLQDKYPNPPKDYSVRVMMHSITYDKMRLFLQREEKYSDAIKYEVLSKMCWCIGLHLQKRFEEIQTMKRPFEFSTLKKAKKENLATQLDAVFSHFLNQLPSPDLSNLTKQVEKLVVN